ncbi:MAG: DKNYY domain-containing protein [Limisphaerales bacterium]
MRILVASCLLLLLVGCSHRPDEDLGHGYGRTGKFIYFNGKRIDQEGAHDLAEFAVAVRHKLTLATGVDAASFKALSKNYSRDQNKVYYRWISGPRFWVVEMPGADPETFEVLGLSLAKDKNHVWKQDSKVEGADPGTTKVMTSRVWKDDHNVWFYGNIVQGADAATFGALGDGHHYRDTNRVYWIFNVVKVVEGADPKTFKPKKR